MDSSNELEVFFISGMYEHTHTIKVLQTDVYTHIQTHEHTMKVLQTDGHTHTYTHN